METTCTGTWITDYITEFAVDAHVTPCLTEDEAARRPALAVMRCTGCTDRMVVVAGSRIERLEAAATDHPDYRDGWVDDIASYVLSCVGDAGSIAEPDGWDYDADDRADADTYHAEQQAEADWLNDLAFEHAEAVRRERMAIFY